MQTPPKSLRVVLDATPLLGHGTGIAVFTRSLFGALAEQADIDLAAFGLSARNNHRLSSVLPRSVTARTTPAPAAVLTRLWQHVSYPPIDWWAGASDVVHGTNFVVPPTRRAAQLVTVHDLASVRFPELCTPQSRRYPALIRAAVKRGAHVHTLSQSAALDVQELLGVASERVHVIAPGLPDVPGGRATAGSNYAQGSGSTEAVQRETVQRVGAPYIFAIGTIEPRKDYATLVRAFDRIAAHRDDVRLVIAGARGWGADEFDQALQASAHRDRIDLAGAITDEQYGVLLRSASVLAYPSLYEGFGYPPLQAMQVGVPVVTTKVASLPEVCGDAAVLVEPRDAVALAEALAHVLSDDDYQRELVGRGSVRAGTFRWDDAVHGFMQLYKELAS